MNKKEKVIVYPFDIEFTPVLRHKQFLKDYEIVGLVSPRGWGLTEEDAAVTDSGEKINIKVSNDFSKLLDSCETVIFTESDKSLDFNKYVFPKILEAVKAGKNIVFTLVSGLERYKLIKDVCREYNVYFKYYNFLENKDFRVNYEEEFIHSIETPVIFVMGMSERTHKFEIQLVLREQLLKMGYKISQVGSRMYCELLGFHSLPGFMYSSSIAEHHKIILFNHYIKSIEINESPDLIIIGIPGGVIPFSNEFTNKFGIMAFYISRAIRPDAAILSVLYEDYKTEYYKELYISLKYKLGIEIDAFNLSNVKFDPHLSRQLREMTFYGIDLNFIDNKKHYKMLELPVYNILNKNDASNIVNCLVDNLSSYSQVK